MTKIIWEHFGFFSFIYQPRSALPADRCGKLETFSVKRSSRNVNCVSFDRRYVALAVCTSRFRVFPSLQLWEIFRRHSSELKKYAPFVTYVSRVFCNLRLYLFFPTRRETFTNRQTPIGFYPPFVRQLI